ncbi:apolipoprotein N-acyltransferase [Streptomyces xiaopingdaonensis]|uniref:apolipoprotein N-acyltransferase n=1 Tax=Streptomyces xiaopingdaonensis TaxID=1565415 RepID=UPI0002DBC950|nr:apolipoprotein N-acyltransferase [Streptomyces xiaopingdaonensis]
MHGALESRWGRWPLSLLAGALPALSFPTPSLWWLAWFGLVPWMLLARTAPTARAAATTGWLGGSAFMLAVHHWLLPSLHVFILFLAALLGLLWAPWGWLVRRVLSGPQRGARTAAALVLLPSGWLMVELVRSWEYLGGPWGLLGASQYEVQPALRLASLGGVWLVSFALVAANTALGVLLVSCAPGTRRLPALAAVAAVAVPIGGAWLWSPTPQRSGHDVRVAVVQPGMTKTAGDRLYRAIALTERLADSRTDLVVWGESSVGFDLAHRPDLSRKISGLAARIGTPILVNVDSARADGGGGIYKSSVLVDGDGLTGQRYDKTRLVPFGEYIPARSVLGWATSVGKAAAEDRQRGSGPVMMHAGGVRIGPLICFETAFPDMSRQLAGDGAEMLVAQSATSSFQESWAPEQHASLAALRAAETWRPVVHATLTGVSAVYGPDGGQQGERLGTDRSGVAEYTAPTAGGTSPYVRFGDWVVHASTTVLLAFCALEWARDVRARQAEEFNVPVPVRR